MLGPTSVLTNILNEMDELFREKLRVSGLEETPFAMVAVSPENQIVLRGNVDPITLTLLSEALRTAEGPNQLPANDALVH